MLCHLATGHLRDATRSSLDPVIELLGLMGPIVAAADEELANHLSAQGLPPFYALSWFITWFSHDLADFGEVRCDFGDTHGQWAQECMVERPRICNVLPYGVVAKAVGMSTGHPAWQLAGAHKLLIQHRHVSSSCCVTL